MAVKVPEAVRQALGDQAVVEFLLWPEEVVAEKTVPRNGYREVLSRLDVLERDVSDVKEDGRELRREMNERFDRVNERFDQMNERFDQMHRHFEARLEQMNARFDQRFDQVNERFDRMNERFDQMLERMLAQTRWLIGSIVLFGTILTILMAIAQFTP